MIRPAAVIVLAAGAGTRMKSTTPKVLHSACGRTLLGHVVAAAEETQPENLVIVVRHERERVAQHATDLAPHAVIADQDDIPGTGRAVWCGLDALPADLEGPVLVTAADTPLLTGQVLADLLDVHGRGGNAVTVLTAKVEDPYGYGRIVRDQAGIIQSVVEHKDATEAQLAIDEINTSIYVFDAQFLRSVLGGLGTDNAQGEMYLTDVVAEAYKQKLPIGSFIGDAEDVEGVNDRVQLAALTKILNTRYLEQAMRDGTTVIDPDSTWVEAGVTFGPDSIIYPGSYLAAGTSIGAGATVGPHVHLSNVQVSDGARVAFTELSDTTI